MRETRISLFITFVVLLAFGIVMIYSSSGVYALENTGNSAYYLARHFLFLGLGAMAMVAMMLIDYRSLQKLAKPLLGITILLLVLVLIPHIGKISFGARRWFHIGPINFQPAELAKPVLIIYLADFLTRKKELVRSFKNGFLPMMFVMGALCLLIVKQPDLGNTVLIFLITLSMFFVAGGRLAHLGLIFFSALPVLVLLVLAEPYRIRRIVAFLDPWADPQGVGFQLAQSQIALGSGGIFGVGLGKSVQKLFYLPAAHTDFIFSIVGEELGFLGAMVLVALFTVFIWEGTRILHQTVDSFGYYLCFGILVMLGVQVVVNIGVSMGALPTKGLPLPFISYGGSALIFNMAAVGLLLNISRTQDLG